MRINDLLADHETVAETTTEAGAPAEPAVLDPAAETPGELEASASVAEEAPATPQFDPSEFQMRLDAADARNSQLEQLLGALLQGSPEAAAAFDAQTAPDFQLDPFADDFGQQLAAFQAQQSQQLLAQIDQRLAQIIQPMQQQREQETIAHGEDNLTGMLDDDIARNGEFHPKPEVDQRARAMVRERANQIYLELAGQYGGHDFVVSSGFGPRVSEQAMGRAASEVRELFKMISSTAVEVNANQMATLAGATTEPGVAAAGVQGPGQFKDARSVVDHYASTARSLTSAT